MGQGYTKGIPLDSDGTLALNSDFLVPTQKAVKTYTDTGLATKQPILTGSEAVLLPSRLLFKQNTDISHTGTLTETLIYSVLIPANTLQANDILRFNIMFGAMTNNANVKTGRIYCNTSNSLVGATLLATRTLTSTINGNCLRNLVFKNSLTSQEISRPTTTFVNDENTSNNNVDLVSINFTVDQYFIVSAQLALGTDVMGIKNLYGEILRW